MAGPIRWCNRTSRNLLMMASLLLTIVSAGRAENLITNADFHTDVLEWDGDPSLADPVWFGEVDEASCPASGVARMVSKAGPGGSRSYISQCVVLPEPLPISVQVSARFDFNAVGVSLEVTAWYYSSSDCNTGFLDLDRRYASEGSGFFTDFSSSFDSFAGAHSMKLVFEAVNIGDFEFLLDSVYAGYASRLFVDDFEPTGQAAWEPTLCRWSNF